MEKHRPSTRPISSYPSKKTASHKIPHWEELREQALNLSSDPDFSKKVALMKLRPKNFWFELGKLLTKATFNDPSVAKYTKVSWEDCVDIVATQVALNNWIRTNHGVNRPELSPAMQKVSRFNNREYKQQPCTILTVKKRVEMARSLCEYDDPILLLGDDDLVGINLARAGFSKVVIVDIDEKVLEASRKVAQKEGFSLEVFKHDLNKVPPKKYVKPYKVIFLDPFYSINGVEIFLKSAIQMTSDKDKCNFFMSLHLMSLMRDGLGELEQLIEKLGLQICDFHPSFNSYPIPKKIRSWIGLANRTITNSPILRSEGLSFPFFTSDALLLKTVDATSE